MEPKSQHTLLLEPASKLCVMSLISGGAAKCELVGLIKIHIPGLKSKRNPLKMIRLYLLCWLSVVDGINLLIFFLQMLLRNHFLLLWPFHFKTWVVVLLLWESATDAPRVSTRQTNVIRCCSASWLGIKRLWSYTGPWHATHSLVLEQCGQ